MKTVIRPESEMKDSGITWIGNIPKYWKFVKLNYVHEISNVGESIDRKYWSEDISDTFFYTAGVLPIHTKYENFPKWKYTKDNDLLLSRNGTPYIYLPISHSVYTDHIIRISVKDEYDKRFVRYCLQQSIGAVVVDTVSIPTWSISLWNKQYITVPPLSEQQAIADYLDETCSKIDEIIAEAKASIDEYKELKQSVIFEAVTKGLDKNVEMKDSGVEGMGFIPAKWPVVRFMKVNYVRARLGWKGLKAEEYVDVGYPFLAAYHIVNGHLCWENLNCITKERYDESPEIKLSIGDLVLVKDGAGIGKCARIDDMPLGEATVNSSLSVITPNKLLDYRYEYYYFMSPLFQNIIARLKNGMGVPHLTQESMKDIYLPLPSKNEQQAIADYLDNKMIGLDSLIAEKESLINDLEAYKKSLIYEVVTGKRRVV